MIFHLQFIFVLIWLQYPYLSDNLHQNTSTSQAVKLLIGKECGVIVHSQDPDTTTNSSWLCSNTKDAGWTTASFNSSVWENAATNNTMPSPWEGLQSGNASWIWSTNDSLVTYCRFTRWNGGSLPQRGTVDWKVMLQIMKMGCLPCVVYCVCFN